MWTEWNLMFPTAIGLPTDRYNYRHSLQRATRAMGIEGTWAPYELRHTWASMVSAEGVTNEAIADAAGNSARMIEDHYRHLTAPVVATHVAAMNSVFGGDAAGKGYYTPITPIGDSAESAGLSKAV